MRKRSIVSIAGVVGITGIMGYLLKNKTNQNQSYQKTIQKAGIPDQLKEDNRDELSENADMVSEGSQYGVSYYNQVQEEKLKNQKNDNK